MEFVIESLRADWEAFLRFAPRLFYAAILLLVFAGISVYAGKMAARVLQRSPRFRTNERFLRLLVRLLIGSVGLLLALGVMGLQGVATSLLATGGAVAIVLGFAFREIGENFLAGFFLSFSRPFELGDLIKTGDLTGVVRTIELRYVHVRTSDACDVYVPSAQIFREALYNYTRDGLRRPSFTIGVAYHEEPDRVIRLLQQAASKTADVLADPAPFTTIKEFAAPYIVYEVFFWLDISESERGLIAIRNEVKARCWRDLREASMTFSADVSSAIEIQRAPQVQVELQHAPT